MASVKLRVFVNGDRNTPPGNVVVPARGLTMAVLMDRITNRLSPPFGAVRRLYAIDGTVIKEPSQLKTGEYYVAAGKQAFKAVPYKLPAGHARPGAKATPTKSRTKGVSAGSKVILVARNGESHAPTRVPIPQRGRPSIDDVVELVNQRLVLPSGKRVSKLYTAEGKPVSSPSQLEDQCLYVACGVREKFTPLSYDLWKSVSGHKAGVSPVKPVKTKGVGKITTSKFNQLETHFKNLVKDKRQMDSLWRALDFNNNGIVSLAEIDKLVVERYPLLDHKPALMRAYKQTTLKDGDGDAWVERREFPALIRNIFYFNKLFHVFDVIDRDDDRRVDLGEFLKSAEHLGLSLSRQQLEQEFALMDKNGGGLVLFDEMCSWVARNSCPVDGEVVTSATSASKTMETHASSSSSKQPKKLDRKADIDTREFDALEAEMKALMADPQQLKAAWRSCDYNGNGICSLAEIDKWVVEQYPLLNSKPALMRAYKQTTLKDGDGDAWVERREFPALIRNIFYFNKLFHVFEDIDRDDDRRLDFDEFKRGLGEIGLSIPTSEARAEFDLMDMNDGGIVLFDEFCAYVARKAIPVDGEVLTEYTRASKNVGTSSGTSAGRKDEKMQKQINTDAMLAKFDAVEERFKKLLSTPAAVKKVWRRIDYNGNGIVSLAEIDKWAVENYPVLNHKPAMMRAYKHTTLKDGDGDAWVEPGEFPALLRNLLYFVKTFTVFTAIDQGQDRRIDVREFAQGQKALGMHLSPDEVKREFAAIDTNGGGQVLFDEFCQWVATKSLPIDKSLATFTQ